MTETPPAAPSIHDAMAAVMADVPAVPKSERNTEQNFQFRGVDQVVNAVGPALRTHRVVPVPHAATPRYRDVQTRGGKTSREVLVDVTYRFYGPAGDYRDVTVPGESIDVSDKGTAKAMSVAYRIALIQTFCLPTDDRDPDQDYHEREQGPSGHGTSGAEAADAPSAEQVRTEIAEEATRQNLDIPRVAADFRARVQQDITEADMRYLQHYLGWLRVHGLPSEDNGETGEHSGEAEQPAQTTGGDAA